MFFAVLVIFVSVFLAVVGMALTHRRVPFALRQAHNVPTGTVFGALQLMFALIVGFSSFFVLTKFHTTQQAVEKEANSVEEIHSLAEQFSEPDRDRIQGLAASYARVVVDDEWPSMRQGRASARAEALANELESSILAFRPSTDAGEQALYSQMLERVHDQDENRDLRLLHARDGLPPILWIVLLSLGANVVFFTYLLGMDSGRLHMSTVVALAASIALVLYTIGTLENPVGDLRVGPYAFEEALSTIEGKR